MKRAYVLTLAMLALAIAVALTACSNGNAPGVSSSSAQGGTAVSIKDMAYSPTTLEAPVGTEVRWANNDSTQHRIAADDGSFDSGNLQEGRIYRFTFPKAGTYAYHDPIYPAMKGKIVVK
jgi:plastocyanin